MRIMTITFRAHFDGKVIVPDEPVDLPTDTLLTLDVSVDPAVRYAPKTTMEERQAAYERLMARIRSSPPVPQIPDEALRRENLYEDD